MVVGSYPKVIVTYLPCLCCRDLVSAWEDNFGTSPVQLQQWRPRDWQDYGCSQDKQNHHSIVACIELEKFAIDHEMSHQQSEKRSLTNTTRSWIAFGTPVKIYNFFASFFFYCTIWVVSFLMSGSLHRVHAYANASACIRGMARMPTLEFS